MTSSDTTKLLADDTDIYLAVSSLEDIQIQPQILDHLHQWELDWDMEFIPGKCVIIHIKRSRTPVTSQYLQQGQVLESVTDSKYMNLAWKSATICISTVTFRMQLPLQVGPLASSKEA